jgi:hypothetical protein
MADLAAAGPFGQVEQPGLGLGCHWLSGARACVLLRLVARDLVKAPWVSPIDRCQRWPGA